MPSPAAEISTRRVRANGLDFAVDEAGDGDDVALFLHGFPESRASWRGQLPALAALGWRAAAPDLRGYGGTSRPLGRDAYRIERLLDDVAGLFEALGARRRLLIGHDWGGLIAWAFAETRRAPLDGLIVLNAPHPRVYARVVRRSPRQWKRSWYVLFFQAPHLPEAALSAGRALALGRALSGAGFPAEQLQALRVAAATPGAMTAMINYYRANMRGLSPGPYQGPPIAAPALLIWGERDPYLGLELTEGYGPYAADFTLRRLPGVSHWVQQEAGDEANALIAEFLTAKGLASPPPA